MIRTRHAASARLAAAPAAAQTKTRRPTAAQAPGGARRAAVAKRSAFGRTPGVPSRLVSSRRLSSFVCAAGRPPARQSRGSRHDAVLSWSCALLSHDPIYYVTRRRTSVTPTRRRCRRPSGNHASVGTRRSSHRSDEHATSVAASPAAGLERQEYAAGSRALARARPADERFPTSSSALDKATSASSATSCRDVRQRRYHQTSTRLYCVGCEAFKTTRSDAEGSVPSTGRSPSGSKRPTTSPISATRNCSRCTTRRDFVLPVQVQRGTLVHPGGLQTSASARGQPWGSRSVDESQAATCGGRADQLLSALTYARPGEICGHLLAGRHHLLRRNPALPLRTGRPCCCRRLPTCRNSSSCTATCCSTTRDLEVARHIIDPLELIDVYRADAVRFWMRGGVVRQDGSGRWPSAGALRHESEHLGTLLSARRNDPLPRRHGQAGGGAGPVDFDALGRTLPASARSTSQGALETIWRPFGASTVRHGRGAVAACEGRRDRTSVHLLYTLVDGLTRWRSRSRISPGDLAEDPRRWPARSRLDRVPERRSRGG